jgi:hypothetical protein
MYDYVKYDYDETNKVMSMYWDKNNVELDKLLNDDMNCFTYKHDNSKKYSCLWIDDLKKYIDYQDGDKILFQIKSKFSYIHIFVKYDIDRKYIFEEIREDGFLYICPFGDAVSYMAAPYNELHPSLQKCNCLYNDFVDEKCNHYILK